MSLIFILFDFYNKIWKLELEDMLKSLPNTVQMNINWGYAIDKFCCKDI
jgi:hypothetical protein